MYKYEIDKIKAILDNQLECSYILFDEKGGIVITDKSDEDAECTKELVKYVLSKQAFYEEREENIPNQGIMISIKYNSKIAYWLYLQGITTNTNNKLVKGYLELIIKTNRQRNEIALNDGIKRSFIMKLIDMGSNDYSEFIEHNAKLINFDLYAKRNIIMLDIIDYLELVKNSKSHQQFEIQSIIQGIREIIVEYLQSNEYCYNLYDDKFIIIKNEIETEAVKQLLEGISDKIKKQYKLNVYYIVSETCSELEDYPLQYSKIVKLHKIHAFKKKPNNIIFTEDNEIEILLSLVSKAESAPLIKRYKKICENLINEGDNEIINTVKAFFKSDMNTVLTGKTLYIHKNTVNYRLNKFVTKTGINIYKPYECMKVFVVLCLIGA